MRLEFWVVTMFQNNRIDKYYRLVKTDADALHSNLNYLYPKADISLSNEMVEMSQFLKKGKKK